MTPKDPYGLNCTLLDDGDEMDDFCLADDWNTPIYPSLPDNGDEDNEANRFVCSGIYQ